MWRIAARDSKSEKLPASVTPTMAPKRKAVGLDDEATEILLGHDLDADYLHKLITLTTSEELAVILGSLANAGDVKSAAIKRTRTTLPSFCRVKWDDLIAEFQLPLRPLELQLEPSLATMCHLPPSFHKKVFESVWHTLDVYQEHKIQSNEAARVRTLDPYLVSVVSLFHGRIVDMPEEPMRPSGYSSGGEVEHEVMMIGTILFLVVEVKHTLRNPDQVAQLFLELLSAAEENEYRGFEKLRVYGLLTDMGEFTFYLYDPTSRTFSRDKAIIVNTKKDDFMLDMIEVTNKMFSVIMLGFIEGIQATYNESKARADAGDVSTSLQKTPQTKGSKNIIKPRHPTRSLAGLDQANTPQTRRKSTEKWHRALGLARQSMTMLTSHYSSIDDLEVKSSKALEVLNESIRTIPRFSDSTGKDDMISGNALEGVAVIRVRKWHEINMNFTVPTSTGEISG